MTAIGITVVWRETRGRPGVGEVQVIGTGAMVLKGRYSKDAAKSLARVLEARFDPHTRKVRR